MNLGHHLRISIAVIINALFLISKIQQHVECLEQAIFRRSEREYLANHVIKTHETSSEFECGSLCVRHGSCASVNYKTSGVGKGRCELNNRTIQQASYEHVLTRPEFNHLYIPSTEPFNSMVEPAVQSKITCSNASWWDTFSKKGWSKCDEENTYITGLYRLSPANDTGISSLKEARCCSATQAFNGQSAVCTTANWFGAMNNDYRWGLCPEGYFLNGLYRNEDNELTSIHNAQCCKPKNHPDKYGSCFDDKDVATSFDQEGWSNCSRADYYIVGLFHGLTERLNQINRFRCCQMAE